MCLIALAFKAHPRWPLVLAGNRDEFHARPTAPLHAWPETPEMLAGRDLSAGGTWLGVSRSGRLAAVTNVRQPALAQGSRSRGALPADFLQASGSPDDFLQHLHPHFGDYGPCNLLLVGDGKAAWASNAAGCAPGEAIRRLQAGVYGLSNAALDSPWPKTLALKSALNNALANGAADSGTFSETLFAALADEHIAADAELPDTGVGLDTERRLAAAFIRGPVYGTRCSTVILVGADGAGTIQERRFGPNGVALGQTALHFHWPVL